MKMLLKLGTLLLLLIQEMHSTQSKGQTKTVGQSSSSPAITVGKFRQRLRLFTGEIYYQILQTTPDNENILFSPTSISHALAIINAGARGNSSAQITEAMKIDHVPGKDIDTLFKEKNDDKFSMKEKSDVIAKMAARSYIQEKFAVKEDYIDQLKLYYNSGVENIDFSKTSIARKRINDWVENNTNKLIKDLIPDGAITPLTRLVMVNALYFKAPWTTRFLEFPPAKFQTPTGEVQVPYLYQKEKMRILDNDNYLYLGLPYNDEKTYFVIAMPKSDKVQKNFERKWIIKSFFETLRNRVTREWKLRQVALHLPKFTVEQSLDLIEVMKGVGVTDVFSQTKANLTGVSDTYLYVSDFLHKARLTVNKEGTEAAAASASMMAARSFTKPVIVNRPFLFGVMEDDGDVLFAGKMVNPSI